LDSVLCGICGITGEVYFGDGNEKNCCDISEVCWLYESVSSLDSYIHVHVIVQYILDISTAFIVLL
jgi:hypothetical protein